jgi:hypothetical protein
MKMPSSGMLRCVSLVRTDVLEEHIASILMMEAIRSSETPVPARATQRNSYCCENLKSYNAGHITHNE